MKIRDGFVANSSSSSYCILGWLDKELEKDTVQKALIEFLEKNDLEVPDEPITIDNFEDFFAENDDCLKVLYLEEEGLIGFDLSYTAIDLSTFKKDIRIFESKCKKENSIFNVLSTSINKEPSVCIGEIYS